MHQKEDFINANFNSFSVTTTFAYEVNNYWNIAIDVQVY